tara:strand:+ start:45315 stop:46322 length:1008 start_codon:yes stop_codon:yes gene_type:complete
VNSILVGLLSITILSYSAISAGETKTISTASIISAAASASCIDYQIVGVCFWLDCGGKCKIKVSPKVAHFNPDLVVSAQNGVGNNPWTEANSIVGTASKSAVNAIMSSLGGIGGDVEAGGNRGGTDKNHQALKFKSADAIGHPAATITIPYRCKSQSSSFYPYFISGVDTLAWRLGVPEMVYPQALMPGVREVGNFPSNTWGSVYPRSGFINQSSDPKAAAVIAQRVADIVTRGGQPHVYSALKGGDGIQDGMKVWPPAGLKENDEKTGKWQMLAPLPSSSCEVFGTNDLVSASGWGGGKLATTGNYAWTLWRPYKCCKKEGQLFLYSIDFKSYP